MAQNQLSRKNKILYNIIIIISTIGLITFITLLFPQVRRMILDWVIQILHREPFSYEMSLKHLLSLASGGICIIICFDYCTLTNSGRALVQIIRQEIKDCLSEIDFKAFVKPVLIMFGIYLLGIFTIIRANFLYMDDIKRSIEGVRGWYDWSRYVSEFLSMFVHADTNLTDISPLPQLLAILILSISSVSLVYIIVNKRITTILLISSIPLGLSPYILECLVFKFDAPYMALSVLTSIIPFLFIARKRAFLSVSVVSLLVMCMTYQAASGIYLMIAVVLCFRYWSTRQKSNKEILSFLGMVAIAFCLSMLLFKFFIMKPVGNNELYGTTNMHPASHILSGILSNTKKYAMNINNDFGIIWKIGILLILFFFIIQSTYKSAQRIILSFFISIIFIGLSFILSFGAYSLLEEPSYNPRALLGFGVFIAALCIYITDFKNITFLAVLALNWCLFVFAFSYGNALADQARYAEFRIGLLLHDLSTLYPDRTKEEMFFQIKNSIDYSPSVRNISKHYPIIERLVPRRLDDGVWGFDYCLEHFNFAFIHNNSFQINNLDSPVVLDSYYHTIQCDGEHVLITLKH